MSIITPSVKHYLQSKLSVVVCFGDCGDAKLLSVIGSWHSVGSK